MMNYEKTVRQIPSTVSGITSSMLVTIFDRNIAPKTYILDSSKRSVVTFGRKDDHIKSNIELNSMLVSRGHGRFVFRYDQWYIEDRGVYGGKPSENGLIYNNAAIQTRALCEGDFIRIDDGLETISDGVLMVFSSLQSANQWQNFRLNGKTELTIGRDMTCSIVIPHVSASKKHARITKENDHYYISDLGSTNGIIVNNKMLTGKQQLHEKDVIAIANTKLIFTSAEIYYCCYRSGISVDVSHVTITRKKKNKRVVTSDDVSLSIKPGELIAIVGGSGAGKSTILNCMSGYLKPDKGEVYINGMDLYQNFDVIKKQIGYVPQSDIVYDELTLHDMLEYTAKLRLPKDLSSAEREAAITRAIQAVALTEKKDDVIKNFSGGQRKRASIAVELLSDPNLLYLDEPVSGQDPGTEQSVVKVLRTMADSGKTVILVTHSTLELDKCDRVIFMGAGGKLCYFGSYKKALKFFNTSNKPDGSPDVGCLYNELSTNAEKWRQKYESETKQSRTAISSAQNIAAMSARGRWQLPVLCSRYLKLFVNDKRRLLIAFIQAPLLAFLISFVANGQEFVQYEMTKGLLFALSCSAFWVGMMNSIQEICKERQITKREYMTGLSLDSYVTSKIIVLGLLCFVQSLLILAVFQARVGLPSEGLFMNPFVELLLTTYFTALSSSALGLFVSSFFKNTDKATTVAPLLLMPQILFSGLIFGLDGTAEYASWFTTCRWSMEGYGTTANLNDLELQMQQKGLAIAHKAESFFEFSKSHLFQDWGILIAFTIVFLLLTRLMMERIAKEQA